MLIVFAAAEGDGETSGSMLGAICVRPLPTTGVAVGVGCTACGLVLENRRAKNMTAAMTIKPITMESDCFI